MQYTGYRLDDIITIDKLYTVYYFEFSNQYRFRGEAHDFWEMVYVDKGQICAVADRSEHLLSQGSIIFHKPNEWHELKADGTVAPNIAVISFSCNSDAMKYFEGKILSVNQSQKKLISRIIAEYSNTFSTPLNKPDSTPLSFKAGSSLGSEQLLRQSICEFLISLLRSTAPCTGQTSLTEINTTDALLNLLVNYMEDNICKTLQLSDLISYSGANKATITATFKDAFGMGAIEYFINLKIRQAKQFIREETYNITQIADILGYSGIHYFSRQFKKITGMSPTDYSRSVRAMVISDKD